MTNDWNPGKQVRRRRRLFFPKNAGASDNAEGVGARLHPFPSLSAVRPSLIAIAARTHFITVHRGIRLKRSR